MPESNYPVTPVDEKLIAGNPVSTGTGNADSGTQRIVLADDQPRIPVSLDPAQEPIPVTSTPNFATRQDTFTATGNGTTVNKSTAPVKKFGLQVKGTGGVPTSWDVKLEGSLDGTSFTEILDHPTAIGDGIIMWSGVLDSPCLYFRSRVAALTLGPASNIVVTILGME